MRMHATLLVLGLASCGGADDGGDVRSDDADQPMDGADDASPAWSVRDVAGVPDLDDDDEDGTLDFEQAPFAANDDLSSLAIDATGDVVLALDAASDVRIYASGALVLGGDAGATATVTGPLTLDVALRTYRTAATLTVTAGDGEATAMLQAAPLVLNHHLQAGEHVWAVATGGNSSMIATLRSVLGEQFTAVPAGSYQGDVWIQDEIELGTLTGDEGQRLDVVVDSIRNRGLDMFAERELAGPGTIVGSWGNPQQRTTYDSFGNLEVTPPVAGHPFGRIYYGLAGTAGLNEQLRAFLGSQAIQAPFAIPTNWLCVGHVDELSSFVPDPSSPKGFKLLIADVRAAFMLLESLDRTAPLSRYAEDHGYPTVGSILDDAELVALNTATQADHVDGILATFMTELGLTEADVIRVPSLWERTTGCNGGGNVLALIPGMVNLLVTTLGDGTTHVFTADPFFRAAGAPQAEDPVIADFERRMPDGLTFHYLDDWNTYHLARGEVHCGTNARRAPSGGWWSVATSERTAPSVPELLASDLRTMAPARTRDGAVRFTSPLIHQGGAVAQLLVRLDARTDPPEVRAALVEALHRAKVDTAELAARMPAEDPAVRAMIAFVARKRHAHDLVERARRDPDPRVRAELEPSR